jgi:nucleoside-diphosphate-sugar epimerase
MRVFVAGATGVVGRPLVAALLAAGHEVTGITRSPQRAEALRPEGEWVRDEATALNTDGPGVAGETARTVATLEDAVLHADGVEGVVLRYARRREGLRAGLG